MPELFFAPPPQHTDAPPPESFDQDAELFGQEVAELDLNTIPFELLGPFHEILPTFIPIISTPSALTYSTDSVHEVSSYYYSSDFSKSDYSIPSDIESYYSSNNGLYGTHDSIQSTVFSNGPPSIPLHSAEAQFEFGTSDLSPNVGIFPEDLSTAVQPPPTTTPLPIHVTPDREAQVTLEPEKRFKCHLCPHCKAKTIWMYDWLTLLASLHA
jgi:hypothetical protein